jgi:hypothetical protein
MACLGGHSVSTERLATPDRHLLRMYHIPPPTTTTVVRSLLLLLQGQSNGSGAHHSNFETRSLTRRAYEEPQAQVTRQIWSITASIIAPGRAAPALISQITSRRIRAAEPSELRRSQFEPSIAFGFVFWVSGISRIPQCCVISIFLDYIYATFHFTTAFMLNVSSFTALSSFAQDNTLCISLTLL